MENLMNNIAKLREKKKLTQEGLGNKVGVTRETIRKWESGISMPSGKNLNKLCEAFEVTLEELLDKTNKKDINDNNDNNDNKVEISIDELRTNLREDLKTDLKADIKEDLRTDLKTDIKEDLRTDLKTDIKEDLKTDLKTDLREDLKTDLKTDLKKDLTIDLKVNLKKDLKTDLKKDLRDDLKSDIIEEQAKNNKKIKITIIEKLIKIILILLIITSFIYFGCSSYKFWILTQIGNKVSKYENLDNYYCEIQTYKDNKLDTKEEIWYKDQKYKIERYTYDDIKEIRISVTEIINLKNGTQMCYNDGIYEKTRPILDTKRYENGRYMYSLFPDILQNDFDSKLDNSLNLNLLKTKTLNNIYRLSIKSLKVELDKDSYAPIFYTNGEDNGNSRLEFKIKLNCVENKNLTM